MNEEQCIDEGNKLPFDATDEWWQGEKKNPPLPKSWAHLAARGVIARLRSQFHHKLNLNHKNFNEVTRCEVIDSLAKIIQIAEKSLSGKVDGCEIKELSLRPYIGRLLVAKSSKDYEIAHQQIFETPDILNCSQEGRFSCGADKYGMLTYLVWGEKQNALCHELSHVVLDLFDRCGIDPRGSNGEPFCYMLTQLMSESYV